MYALLILDIQVGLIHGPEKPWRCDELLETLNKPAETSLIDELAALLQPLADDLAAIKAKIDK